MSNSTFDNKKVELCIYALNETIKNCGVNFLEAYQAIKSLNYAYSEELKRRIKDTEVKSKGDS